MDTAHAHATDSQRIDFAAFILEMCAKDENRRTSSGRLEQPELPSNAAYSSGSTPERSQSVSASTTPMRSGSVAATDTPGQRRRGSLGGVTPAGRRQSSCDNTPAAGTPVGSPSATPSRRTPRSAVPAGTHSKEVEMSDVSLRDKTPLSSVASC